MKFQTHVTSNKTLLQYTFSESRANAITMVIKTYDIVDEIRNVTTITHFALRIDAVKQGFWFDSNKNIFF